MEFLFKFVLVGFFCICPFKRKSPNLVILMLSHIEVTSHNLGDAWEGSQLDPKGHSFLVVIRCIDRANPKLEPLISWVAQATLLQGEISLSLMLLAHLGEIRRPTPPFPFGWLVQILIASL